MAEELFMNMHGYRAIYDHIESSLIQTLFLISFSWVFSKNVICVLNVCFLLLQFTLIETVGLQGDIPHQDIT